MTSMGLAGKTCGTRQLTHVLEAIDCETLPSCEACHCWIEMSEHPGQRVQLSFTSDSDVIAYRQVCS